MKALIQRVSEAEVSVNGESVSSIGRGLLVFLGVEKGDTDGDIEYLVKKVSQLRIFEDAKQKLNLSVQDVKGEIIVVSQFTLLSDCRKGNRPSFDRAEESAKSEALYIMFAERLRQTGLPVSAGEFGAHMKVHLINDGPVTIILDSRK
ncbi:MAG: D-aminoacyl-tRNA deacylase [Nitrospirota bacterium]